MVARSDARSIAGPFVSVRKIRAAKVYAAGARSMLAASYFAWLQWWAASIGLAAFQTLRSKAAEQCVEPELPI